MQSSTTRGWLLAGALLAQLLGCASDDNDARAGSSAAPGPGGAAGASGANPSGSGGAGGGELALKPFTRPVDPKVGGSILFAASGETLAQTGYAFPAGPDDPQFYDGWDVKFDRLLVTFDNLVLSANPDKDNGDQSQTDGAVATVKGPWAVDLHREDATQNIDGKSQGERAIPIAAISNQDSGAAFATDGTRYGFGFDAVAATAQAMNVNLDADALADYQEMEANGCVVFYAGTATFKGDKTDAACYPADRKSFPDVVKFRLCFKSPTTYINCQNPDNTGMAFANEESQRGIAFDANAPVLAQITFHTDHPFWDSVIHDSPAHFDQLAARVVGQDGGTPTATLESTKGVDYTAYTDALGNALRWRYCSDPPTDAHPKLTGPMAFDSTGVSGLRDYYDFATFNQSTQGHLNADGLCFVRRNY